MRFEHPKASLTPDAERSTRTRPHRSESDPRSPRGAVLRLLHRYRAHVLALGLALSGNDVVTARSPIGTGGTPTKTRISAAEHPADVLLPDIFQPESMDIPREMIGTYLNVSFPRPWIDGGHLAAIELGHTEKYPLPFSGLEHEEVVAWTEPDANDARRMRMVVAESAYRPDNAPSDVRWLLGAILPHGIATANNWDHASYLNAGDKARIQREGTALSQAVGRPLFPYAEAIHASGHMTSEQVGLYRAQEYFAELVWRSLNIVGDVESTAENWEGWRQDVAADLCFSYGASSEQAERNAVFVQSVFGASDPAFKPWVAAREARQLVGRMQDMVGFAHLDDFFGHRLPADVAGVLVDGLSYAPTKREQQQDQDYLDIQDGFGSGMGVVMPPDIGAHIAEVERVLPRAQREVWQAWQEIVADCIHLRVKHLKDDDLYSSVLWQQLESAMTAFTDQAKTMSKAERDAMFAVFVGYASAVLHHDPPRRSVHKE